MSFTEFIRRNAGKSLSQAKTGQGIELHEALESLRREVRG